MTNWQVVGRVLLVLVLLGLLAAAAYAIYRLGFSAGVASIGPLQDLRGWAFERGPRLGGPDRFPEGPQGMLRPGVRMFARYQAMTPWFSSPWLGLGVLLAAGAVVALVVVLFRCAFRSGPAQPASPQAGSGQSVPPEGA